MTEERKSKIEFVLANRQSNITVVLEDVQDPRNISAVMRTCDAVGIKSIYVINTNNHLPKKFSFKSGRSADKWVAIHEFSSVKDCIQALRKQFSTVLTTHFSEDAKDLYSIDFTQSIAVVFGNEQKGLSQEMIAAADGSFLIPQVGMVQSLNISVACAVTIYEAFRQKKIAGHFQTPSLPTTDQQQLAKEWGIY